MANQGNPHKAKPTATGRKYYRNISPRMKASKYRERPKGDSYYVIRMKRRGTFRIRKGISKKSGA